jgi:hypothetical protein
MRHRNLVRPALCGAATLSLVFLVDAPAHAYNWKTHVRMVEVAAQLMTPNSTYTAGAAPSGVNATQWQNYITAINNAYTKLGVLQSALPNAGTENATVCNYNAADNMSDIPNVRIEDMTFLPIQGGQVIAGGSQVQYASGGCSELPIACSSDNNLRVGRILGWQGASVDDRLNDTTLWIKLTQAGGLGLADKLLSDFYQYSVGALILPFVCFADFLSGKSCSFNQAENLANETNPFELLEGAIPGLWPGTSYNYVGFWHFIDVAAGPGQFNNPRGMLYESAGPYPLIMSPIDVIIMAASDTIGWSIDAKESDGVSRYGQFDTPPVRSFPLWQAFPYGHIEFSPVSNLAAYGWQQFVANPTSALGLSWPLHAFGDAAEPQHVAGTTGWGHRPYEDEVDFLLDQNVLPPPTSCTLALVSDNNESGGGSLDPDAPPVSSAQAARILLDGFNFWSTYQSQFAPGQVPVQEMITDLANQTLQLAFAAEGNQVGSVYNDIASIVYQSGAPPLVSTGTVTTAEGDGDQMYDGQAAVMQSMIEVGTGAIIAFLTGASLTAKDPGTDGFQACVSGDVYSADAGNGDGGCVGPPTFSGSFFVDAGDQLCNGNCSSGGQCEECGGDASCEAGNECSNGCCQPTPPPLQ